MPVLRQLPTSHSHSHFPHRPSLLAALRESQFSSVFCCRYRRPHLETPDDAASPKPVSSTVSTPSGPLQCWRFRRKIAILDLAALHSYLACLARLNNPSCVRTTLNEYTRARICRLHLLHKRLLSDRARVVCSYTLQPCKSCRLGPPSVLDLL